MKLHYAPTSPFVRKVMVLLHETETLDQVTLNQVVTSPFAPSADVQAQNPLAKIPALEREDGGVLFDSRVICDYLNMRAGADLYNKGWDSKVLEALADGLMDAAVLAAYELRLRPEDQQSQDWIKAQHGKVLAACTALNAQWMPHLEGMLDIGQIAVACGLGYVDFRHPTLDWRADNLALAAWFEGFESRASMQATRPPKG
ncbi:glutathione S-transferase [Pseudophaeobacter flagellatus]|uniref:glutathione S-transferase n=1 Tax=Pseudophaeobacter flagellatus TaxID=2899119 RepID=UPI001E5329D4|nr:glutathione S-transferase [Pseudophaeobacter flagellatus]MCD9147243.1 glutathione S-transferase [Pseudophaeobacter flagellatus]